MILGVDIGNTHVVTGLFDMQGNLILKFRVASNIKLTEDEYFSYLKTITDFNKVQLDNIDGFVISSVVPDLITIFIHLAQKYFKIEPLVVSTALKLPFSFDDRLEEPNAIGADRLIDVTEAVTRFPDRNLVVIDLGTATTFEIVEKKVYTGGCILPGINLSINALFNNTAKLPRVKFEKPETIFGRSTVEHINIGVYYGTIGQVKEILSQIKKKVKNPYVITTGGLSQMISKEIDEIDDCIPDLSLYGLYTFYLYNKK